MKAVESPDINPLVTLKFIATYLAVCERTIYRWMQIDPDFPKPIKVRSVTRFKLAEVLNYVGQKCGGSN